MFFLAIINSNLPVEMPGELKNLLLFSGEFAHHRSIHAIFVVHDLFESAGFGLECPCDSFHLKRFFVEFGSSFILVFVQVLFVESFESLDFPAAFILELRLLAFMVHGLSLETLCESGDLSVSPLYLFFQELLGLLEFLFGVLKSECCFFEIIGEPVNFLPMIANMTTQLLDLALQLCYSSLIFLLFRLDHLGLLLPLRNHNSDLRVKMLLQQLNMLELLLLLILKHLLVHLDL